ncbi:MAG: hypothetical protein AB2A00_40990 [Myxococcota bacterium]
MPAIGRIAFDAPPGFALDETSMSFVVPPVEGKPKVHQSILVHARTVPPGASLIRLAGQTLTELTSSVKGITDVTQAELQFDDGTTGLLFLYSLPARGQEVVRQYHALRLDGDQLTTMTLTALLPELDESTANLFLKTIGSLGKGGKKP